MLVLLFSLLAIFYILRDLVNGRRLRNQANLNSDRFKEERQDEIPSRGSSRRNSEAVKIDRLKFQLSSIAGDGLLSPLAAQKKTWTKGPNETLQPGSSRSRRSSTVADTVVTHPMSYDEVVERTDIHEFPTPKESPVYSMDKRRRGKCVIFHHYEFDEGNGDVRQGSEYDVEKIEKVFEKQLGFEIEIHNNLKYIDICEVIRELSEMEDHTDADCICVFILSHGSMNGKLHARDVSYPFHTIWKAFLGCRSLIGKPKLFFVQACRGRNTDEGNMGRHATDSTEDMYTIPTHADFLFGYSTVDGHYSFRDKTAGTWYIHSLCEVISNHWRTYDLVKMLTETSRSVAFCYTSISNNPGLNEKKQIPTFTSTLTRDLYFTPKG